ncbi:MAG: DUF58 domain-containing protein [Deltaproteobacteria bacterium]|nr:DUF58 domain-containing protein [Deltaproteobacteria bacterium]
MSLDPDVAQRVQSLTLSARRAVEGLLSGMHRSPHRGASVVFVEHREYRPGDDPRLLDWRAFARTDRDVIKRFEQETQLRATLVLDRSGSMAYPKNGKKEGKQSGPADKHTHAATLLSALAYVLIRQGDAAGAALFTDEVGDVVPPRTRPAHLETVLTALAQPAEPGAPTDLRAALYAVAERAGRRGVVAIASDLIDLQEDALAPIAHLVSRGHEVILFHVLHPDEIDLPFPGPTRFLGCEGEEAIDADADAVRRSYKREIEAFIDTTRRRAVAAGARYTLARTDGRPEQQLGEVLAAGRRNPGSPGSR